MVLKLGKIGHYLGKICSKLGIETNELGVNALINR